MLRIISLIVLCSFLTGCSTVKGVFGKHSVNEAKQSARIEQVQQAQTVNRADILKQISSLSYGVGFSLDAVTNISTEVTIAKDLNGRILSLSGMPSVDEVRGMEQTVNNLRTNVAFGQRLLADRDTQITRLQNQQTNLETQSKVEIQKYMALAESTARKADTTQNELNDYKGWFGLKAVAKGLFQFARTSLWIMVGLLIVFLILRFAAASNPIASAVFGLFEQVVSWFINGIKTVFPKAIHFASLVPQVQFQNYKQTLSHIIDSIELLKQKTPNATLTDVLTECAKAMDADDKARVDEIKKELHW